MGGGGDDFAPSTLHTWAALYEVGLGLGLRPREFWDLTFAEFAFVVKGENDRDRRLWEHTSSVMALVANSNRDPKRRPQAYTVEDFNPYILNDNKSSRGREVTQEEKDLISQWRVNPSSP